MKAVVHTKYGTPDNLQIAEADVPQPRDDEVLIRIAAASVNDWDWGIINGKPFYIRFFCGLLKPKVHIPGVDISGVVEKIGKDVVAFQPGDEIYGDLSECGFGGFADYVCVPEGELTHKPGNISHVDAAAIPHAALLALQALRDIADLEQGQSLLINGAGGGVGTLGLQIANAMGVDDVDGVDSADKADMMRSAGFQQTIDYRHTDFTRSEKKYDVILDPKTNRSVFKYLRVLKDDGTYVTVGGSTFRLIQILVLSRLIRFFTGKKTLILALKPNRGMDFVNELIEAEQLKPVIDGPHEFAQAIQAITRFGKAEHLGKVVIEVRDSQSDQALVSNNQE